MIAGSVVKILRIVSMTVCRLNNCTRNAQIIMYKTCLVHLPVKKSGKSPLSCKCIKDGTVVDTSVKSFPCLKNDYKK
jgi:hypothetical protein